MRLRFDLLGDGRRVLGTIGNKTGTAPVPVLVPDVKIDFATGAGIPAAIGGAGDWGAELVQITSPQSGAGFYRRVKEAYDPGWKGYPLFEPKPADHLVGWAGPRPGGYWAGPMAGLTSTSEAVAVYSSTTGLTVTPVAGGVVGPDAIRCDVAAGQYGSWWPAWPRPTMSSGWLVGGNGAIFYAHAVLEVFGDPGIWSPYAGIYDDGGQVFIEAVEQTLTGPDGPRSGKIYRGVGPHGGHLYEWWAITRLISAPVGYIGGLLYVLNALAAPARSMVVHGVQLYLRPRWDVWPIYGVPPFFSYARGAAVVWTAETLEIVGMTGAYSAAVRFSTSALGEAPKLATNFSRIVARNGNTEESWYQYMISSFRAWSPDGALNAPFAGRAVVQCAADYTRRATVNGSDVEALGTFTAPAMSPQTLQLGRGDDYWFGQFEKLHLWRRALTDAEMLKAFGQL